MYNGKQGEQLSKRGGQRGEQPNDIRVATKSCNMKHIIAITWINLNHNSSTALERAVINDWEA